MTKQSKKKFHKYSCNNMSDDPAELAAWRAFIRARSIVGDEAFPEGYTVKSVMEDTYPIYQLRIEAEERTGFAHDVLHLTPLGDGGQHIASNLSVIPVVMYQRRSAAGRSGWKHRDRRLAQASQAKRNSI